MYEQTLPGVPDSIPGAQAWIRGIASTDHANLADDAATAVGMLVSIALRRTPARGTIHLKATATEYGLKIEARDPGNPVTDHDGAEWAEVSCLAWSFRSCRTDDGHLSEVEIRARQTVTACPPSSPPRPASTAPTPLNYDPAPTAARSR